MLKNLFLLGVVFLTSFCSCCLLKDSNGHKITLTNVSDVELTDKAIVVKRKDLRQIHAEKLHPLLISERGDTLSAQLDDVDGDNKWDELFFVTNLPAGGQENFNLKWSSSETVFGKRTSVRFGVRQTRPDIVQPAISDTFYADQLPGIIGYQHYQTDGPTWENDKVGFRLYLDGRNSIDVFGKKVSYMTPEDVGIGGDGMTENNYSVMKDWGTDILGVGNSVGIGGISLIIKDSLVRLGVTEQDSSNNVDSTIFKILSEGPVRSIMQYTYKNWRPADRAYLVQTNTSIWPGMYAFNNSVSFNHLKGDEVLVVGLVNSNTDKKLTEIIHDKWVVLLTHDKQSVNKEWWLGLALILPKEQYLGYTLAPKVGSLSNTFLGKLEVENNKPLNYFAVAGWELSDERFRDEAFFTKYVNDLVRQISAEVKVKVK